MMLYIEKIEANRHATGEGSSVNYDISIKPNSLQEKDGRQMLVADYRVTINYLSPSIGHLNFEGKVEVEKNGDLSKEYADWCNDKPSTGLYNELVNSVMLGVAPLALLLSRSIDLPPAVPLPGVEITEDRSGAGHHDEYAYHG
jgi:hypothetical protein